MKLPNVILRRFEWRLRLQSRPLRVPSGMTRAEFEAGLSTLPPGIDADELLEFVELGFETGDEAGTPCPVFRERLRRLLWSWVGHSPSAQSLRVGRLLN